MIQEDQNNSGEIKPEGEIRNDGAEPGVATVVEKKEPTAEEISAKLSGGGSGIGKGPIANEPEAAAPIPFDFSKLTRDDLQRLKEAMDAVPDRATAIKKNPRVNLRRMDGRFVKSFGKAFNALVKDTVERRDIETHKIPVLFFDAEASVDVLYKDFMESERVLVEVIKIRTESDNHVEGEVYSKEKKRMVEMEVTRDKHFFTVRLPDGKGFKEVEIESRVANA